MQARKSKKRLSKRLVPFSEPEKSLQVLNTAQTKQFGQKNSTLHAHEVRKKIQQLIGCYGTILSAQSKELFFFIMFANRLEFVWTWIRSLFFPRSRYILHQND